jgi:hypothetical protein
MPNVFVHDPAMSWIVGGKTPQRGFAKPDGPLIFIK